MRCIGRNKNWKRCRNNCKFLFCHHHRYQALGAIFTICTIIIFSTDLFLALGLKKPIDYIFSEEISNSNDNCTTYKSTSQESSYKILIANWEDDEEISNKIFTRLSKLIHNDSLPIELTECPLYIDKDKIDYHLKKYNAILYGSFFDTYNTCISPDICYSYALDENVFNSFLTRSNLVLENNVIKTDGKLQVAKGFGQENYDYLIYWLTGLSYLNLENFDKAIDYFEIAKTYTQNFEIKYWLALAHSSNKDLLEAEKLFEEVYPHLSGNCNFLLHYSIFKDRCLNLNESIRIYQEALDKGCSFEKLVKIEYANNLCDLGEYELAMEAYNEIDVEGLSDEAQAYHYYGLGVLHRNYGFHNNISRNNIISEDFFIKSLNKRYNMDALVGLGILYGNLGNQAKAFYCFKKAQEDFPENVLPLYHLGKQYYLSYDKENAIKTLKNALDLLGDDDFSYYNHPSIKEHINYLINYFKTPNKEYETVLRLMKSGFNKS